MQHKITLTIAATFGTIEDRIVELFGIALTAVAVMFWHMQSTLDFHAHRVRSPEIPSRR